MGKDTIYAVLELFFVVYDSQEKVVLLWSRRSQDVLQSGTGAPWADIKGAVQRFLENVIDGLDKQYLEFRGFAGWTVYPMPDRGGPASRYAKRAARTYARRLSRARVRYFRKRKFPRRSRGLWKRKF